MFFIYETVPHKKARDIPSKPPGISEDDVSATANSQTPPNDENCKQNSAQHDSDDVVSLVKRAQEGDDDAFSLLVEMFGKFVYNTACRALSSAGISLEYADDIAQDSLIKAWRALPQFRHDCSFTTWIYRIAGNTARDFIRQSSRRKHDSLTSDDCDSDGENDRGETDVPVTSGDTVPEDALDRKERILAVRSAIESLPDDQRQVIIMRDIHELPYQVIAKKLGLELGTVKSRLNRGRMNLKQILKNGNFL